MLTSKTVAKILGIGVQTLERWAVEGRIKYERIDNELMFEETSVEEFINVTGIKLIEPETHIEEIKNILQFNQRSSSLDIATIRNKHAQDKQLLSVEEINKIVRERSD